MNTRPDPRHAYGNRAVFLYGFAKNECENIKDDELATLKEIAMGWLEEGNERIEHAIEKGLLEEVNYGKRKQEAKPADKSDA
jgi:hypothetical protein